MRILLASAFCLTISGLGLAQTTPAVVSPPSVPSVSGCTTTATRPSDQTRFSERNPRYHLEPGDSSTSTFEFVPDFNQTVIVQPDGFVTLRGIGDTKVANQTLPELTSTLCVAYGKIMATPSLFIVLKDFNKPYFSLREARLLGQGNTICGPRPRWPRPLRSREDSPKNRNILKFCCSGGYRTNGRKRRSLTSKRCSAPRI